MKKYVFILLSLYSIGSYATTHDASTDNNNSNLLVQLVDTKLKANQEAMAELNDKVDTKLADKFKQLDDKGTCVSWWLNMLSIWLTALGIFAPIGGYLLNRRINENIKNSSDTIEKEVHNLQTEINHKLQEANQVLNKLGEIHKNASLKANEITELAEQLTEQNILPENIKKALDSAKQIQHKLTAEEWFIMGFGAQQNKEYDDAMVYYKQAVKLSNNDRLTSMIYNNLGIVKAKLGQYIEAIQDYNRAIELNPKHAKVYYNRGISKAKLERYIEAIQDYDRAIQLDPQHAKAYSNRGVSKAKLGLYTEAIQDYDKAIKLDPKYTNAHFNKACAYARMEDKVSALKTLKVALDLGCLINKVQEDDAWGNYLDDAEFKELINKYDKNNHAN